MTTLHPRYKQMIRDAVVHQAMRNGMTFGEAKRFADATIAELNEQDIRDIFSDQLSTIGLLKRVKSKLANQ